MLIRLPALCIAMSFATAALAQDEGDDIFPQGSGVALDVSTECIVGALQRTFGMGANISTSIAGSISAMVLSGSNMTLAEVMLNERDHVLGLSTTIRIGMNREGSLAPQGTAYLDYTFNSDIGYDLIGGLDFTPLRNLTLQLDQELRSCAPAPAMLMG